MALGLPIPAMAMHSLMQRKGMLQYTYHFLTLCFSFIFASLLLCCFAASLLLLCFFASIFASLLALEGPTTSFQNILEFTFSRRVTEINQSETLSFSRFKVARIRMQWLGRRLSNWGKWNGMGNIFAKFCYFEK